MSQNRLVFVYNAKGGALNTLMDFVHKTVSPNTYPCPLCAVTYGNLGMKRRWAAFIQSLPVKVSFRYADNMERAIAEVVGEQLPAACLETPHGIYVLMGPVEFEMFRKDLDKLIEEMKRRLEPLLSRVDEP